MLRVLNIEKKKSHKTAKSKTLKGAQGNRHIMYLSIKLIVVFAYVYSEQIIHIKYVQFFVYQLCHIKAVKIQKHNID